MKKRLILIFAVTGLLVSCPNSDNDNPGNKPVGPQNPDDKTFVVFDNTNGICAVSVYDDHRRRDEDKLADIPEGKSSDKIKYTPGDKVPFYFSYNINLKGVSGFALNYVPGEIGKDQKSVRVDEGKITNIPISALDEAVSSHYELLSINSYLLIQNNSTYSFELHRGVSGLRPDSASGALVNSGERAQYTIDPGAASNYQLLVGANYIPFSGPIVSFEAGRVYGFDFNGNISLISEVEIILENVAGIPQRSVQMVYVHGGSFEMGKELGTAKSGDTRPVHTVTLSGFAIGKYEVTQAQYQAVMGRNPSDFSSNPASGEVQENRPVENVTWYAALVFCNKLSVMEGLSPAYSISGSTNPSDWGTVPTRWNSTWNAAVIVAGSKGYRLPTEAQWEYAAKGGSTPGNYTYSGSNTGGAVAWYSGNSNSRTHEVGKKAPNGLGLYDMSGNVWEWCWDWYGDYTSGAQTNPVGAAAGAERVMRGGDWDIPDIYTRLVNRRSFGPYDGHYWLGFRLVRP